MVPRRCRAVLALTAALIAGAGSAYAQGPVLPPPTAPGRPLIADSHGQPPPTTSTTAPPAAPPAVGESLPPLSIPDDGLIALPTPPIAPAPPADGPRPDAVRQAAFRPDAATTGARAPWVVLLPAAPAAAPTRQGPQVAVEVAGPASAASGESLHYEIVVRNSGATAAARVRVEEPLPSGARLLRSQPPASIQADLLGWDLGGLEAGGERRLSMDLEYSGKDDLVCAPRVAYSAAEALRTRVLAPPLTVTLTGPDTADCGAAVAFGIELSNNGRAPLRNVVVRDNLPAGLRHPQGDAVEADIGDLAPGQSRTIHLSATAAKAGNFVNEVVATADGGLRAVSHVGVRLREAAPPTAPEPPRQGRAVPPPDAPPVEGNTVKASYVEADPGLQVELLAQEDPLPLGGETIYLVRVHHRGDGPATNVRLTVLLPDGLVPLQADGPTTFRVAGRQAVADPLPAMPTGQTLEYHVRVRARNTGTWRLEADLGADRLARPVRELVAVHVTEAGSAPAAAFASGR